MNKFTPIFLLLFSVFTFAQDIEIESFATGFSSPIGIENAGDSRLFIVERRGIIKIVNDEGDTNAIAYLNIDGRVTNNGGEQGLLGLAFHPNYATNGYFYVNYINNSGDTVVSRFSRDATNPDIGDSNSELILLTIDQPFSNHNGGDLAFGVDGYLYIALGDGGSANDPGNRAQNLTTLLGKMLRIDVDNTSNGNNYAIPADNPFFGSTTNQQEIWAYGLRNPWRFSFDSATNDLWIADVGQNEIEEINRVNFESAGVNYGWRCYEGNDAFNLSGCPAMNTLTFPVATYTHSSSGNFKCSITGGYRYRGTAQPNLQGLYFFADYCSNEIGILEEDGANWNMTFTEPFSGNNWVAFGEDIDGELYIAGVSSGTIYRIVDANLSVDESSLSSIKMYPNPTDDLLTLNFGPAFSRIASLTIYNIQGQKIQTYNSFENQISTISTKTMSDGLYLVEIRNIDGQKLTQKLVKH
uniref:PQQ-dependent sugar dehydrogenase n=1 Tax=Gelidibacter sp. TaxID=2018083 RepID=UPI004049F080